MESPKKFKKTEISLMPREALSHLLEEIELPNMIISLESNFEEIRKAHNSIHEFIYLAPLFLPSKTKVSWCYQKSAFLDYHFQAFYQAHRSFLEVLSGYYNSGYILLRSVLELLLKGAFWECLAHKKFRDSAEIIKKEAFSIKVGRSRKTILDWLNDVIAQKPSIEKELEETSRRIFDKIDPIFENSKLRDLIPKPKVIIKQLAAWGILDSIPSPIDNVYKIYNDLSAEVHVIPDKIDIGRRLLSQKDLFEIDVMPRELNKFMMILHEVVDIGIVIELNVLSDWISWNGKTKAKLKERLAVIENLELKFSLEKLKSMVRL